MDLKAIIKESGVSVAEFASIANVTRAAVYIWIKKGNIENTSAIRVVEATLKIIEQNKKKNQKKSQKKGGKNDAE